MFNYANALCLIEEAVMIFDKFQEFNYEVIYRGVVLKQLLITHFVYKKHTLAFSIVVCFLKPNGNKKKIIITGRLHFIRYRAHLQNKSFLQTVYLTCQSDLYL